ncbi:2-phospho-L-lactate guanylyltransferase [Cryobacterium fucosi]|uniref:Phosphoenolpyruvate guanylyltransferase n=1 Tax=Cryobacterium fucosi TaxID=1259157 RepID=A0A4R9B1G5_9MICO|nr:2-phospho-L-lactate guanylyltransferase [Cryobacterium fucosi]TFD73311.1 2-phospho-L-lactate guanylyltransferase [Cryobacterium fucosi]
MESEQSARWVAVVPVKGNPGAKSRLGERPDRARLADAFALDTVAAVRAARGVDLVLVVTADDEIGARLADLGAEIVPEGPAAGGRAPGRPGHPLTMAVSVTGAAAPENGSAATLAGMASSGRVPVPADPMNAAIRTGLAAARARFPRANLMVLTGDLPALTPADVERALALAAGHERSMLPDAAGTGTTTLFALAGVPIEPRFGPGSRAAHEAAGHVPLDIPPSSSIRCDVDTAADLLVAERLGLGAHTLPLVADDSVAAGGS